jgi:hypothetical protein
MSESNRRVFIVVAGGNLAAERHFEDTIQRKRTLSEVKEYLPDEEINNLENIYHGSPFIVWGAVPGTGNEATWTRMRPGDIVLIYNKGYIKFAGEIAAKVRSKELARYFWRETEVGDTWELIYFIVNDEKVNVPFLQINPLFGYKDNFLPRGFTMINEAAVENFAIHYGDLMGVLRRLERGEKLIIIPQQVIIPADTIEENIEKAPTDHDEMQWRLIRLGKQAKCDIWIPKNDQGKQFDGHAFRDYIISEFHESLDVPPSIKNIDVVWKFGPYDIKSAFEIENSTSVYSGILRLSDVRAMTPNSSYPLFIVAPEEKRRKVFEELRRPTFSGPCLQMDKVVNYLSYEALRKFDYRVAEGSFDISEFKGVSESIAEYS